MQWSSMDLIGDELQFPFVYKSFDLYGVFVRREKEL